MIMLICSLLSNLQVHNFRVLLFRIFVLPIGVGSIVYSFLARLCMQGRWHEVDVGLKGCGGLVRAG